MGSGICFVLCTRRTEDVCYIKKRDAKFAVAESYAVCSMHDQPEKHKEALVVFLATDSTS